MAVFIVTLIFQALANGLVFAADNNDAQEPAQSPFTLKGQGKPVILIPGLMSESTGLACT